MDLQKAKIFLDKINALYKNMGADKKNISTIEMDLMKSYIQQFYETFLDMPGEINQRPAVELFKSKPKVTLNKPEEKREVPLPPPLPVSKPARTPEPEPEPEPKIQEPVIVVEKPAPPPVSKPEPPKPAPTPVTPAPETAKPAAPVSYSSELEELFDFDTAKELSEKLSQMPITDIKKAMGLNDRIFTVNELFGGDQAVFDLTVDTLNKLSDFNQAKNFLMRNAASKYNWENKGKKSKAKNFIKLVKRRYS